ncbi:MAG: DMT family transporter [Candidatus Poriferisodalaceae bacterium]|tara:strand:+ start:9397 stop:10284 length:888 start_codon:yes stop_codon:yes gene_type:complete
MKVQLTERNGSAVVFLTGTLFSFSPLLFRWTSGEGSEWLFLLWRSIGILIAALIGLSLSSGAPLMTAVTTGLGKNLLAGALMAGMSTSFIISIARIDAATTLLLQSLAPFSAAFLGWLVLREKVDGHTWAAMTTAVVGVVIMGSTWDSSSVVGISAACCIPLMLGIYTVLLRDSQRRDPRAQVFFTGVIGLVIGLVASAATGGFALPIQDIFLALISGGILLGVGLPIFNAAGRHVPAARTSLLLLSEIVLAPIWVWLVVNEVPAGKTVAGGAVILLALVWVTTHPKALLVSQPS